MFTYDDDPREHLRRAIELLKSRAGFLDVQGEVMDRIRAVNAEVNNQIPTHDAPRLEYALKLLNARAEPYLKLISDLPSQEAYAVMLREFGQITWGDYAVIVGVQAIPGDQAMAQIESRMFEWLRESYRRASGAIKEEPTSSPERAIARRGYRREVNAWMEKHQIRTVELAARRLAISKSTLKSMSDRGVLRCSDATLQKVLRTIGVSRGE